VPLGSMRHSPLCFTGISALGIMVVYVLSFPLVSVIGLPASCISKAGFQAGPADYANACLGRILSWPVPYFRYFHTRLAPDYAE
jgi:hypothetical protein